MTVSSGSTRRTGNTTITVTVRDAYRLFLMGNSSGGHVAMISTLFAANGLVDLLPIRATILQCASTDIRICASEPLPPWFDKRPTAVLLGVDQIEVNEELARKASCVTYIKEDIKIPPILMFHSDSDPIVSVENSRTLYDKLMETGHEVEYYELKDNDAHCGNTYYSATILDIVKDFCERH